MCHRVVPLTLPEVEQLLLERKETGHARLAPSENASEPNDAYPSKPLAIIAPDASGELVALERRWGFQDPRGPRSKLVFNTRLDTALAHASKDAGMWSHAIMSGRCLIPVRAFYESWTRNPPRRGAQVRFTYRGHAGLLLAGIFEDDCCSIVTTSPNSAVSPYHSRMPLCLGPGESGVWLGPDFASLANRSAIPLEATYDMMSLPRN